MDTTNECFVEVMPQGSLELLSPREVERLQRTGEGSLHSLLRSCALAVLSAGSHLDSATELLDQHSDFELAILQRDHGVTLALTNAPASAFVDGQLVRGIAELLFAVLRDIVFIDETGGFARRDQTGDELTHRVFDLLRNAGALCFGRDPDMVVCWGGHSIGAEEYDYTKAVGYELGLRGLSICTGCGPGAMKGPMKGATIGHGKQRIAAGRFLGITEPGIMAAEPPNPIVRELVIMPDMEKRLEAFVRVAHAIVIFPGGVGTLEELLYLLGILLHPENADLELPVVVTGPAGAAAYLNRVHDFIGATLGEAAQARYVLAIDDSISVGRLVRERIDQVTAQRREQRNAFFFNWRLRIDTEFQQPFVPTHQAMAQLALHREQPAHMLAANLRRAFSGLVAGNIREDGIRAIAQHGPFEISGDPAIMAQLDALLAACVEQGRMRLPGKPYEPCYRLAAA